MVKIKSFQLFCAVKGAYFTMGEGTSWTCVGWWLFEDEHRAGITLSLPTPAGCAQASELGWAGDHLQPLCSVGEEYSPCGITH